MAPSALHRFIARTSFLLLILTPTALAFFNPGALSAAGDAAKSAGAAGDAAKSAEAAGNAAKSADAAGDAAKSAEADGDATKSAEATGDAFIRNSCSSCPYPDLCFSSLESYASHIGHSRMELADTALSISLEAARSAASSDTGDCMGSVFNAINDLKESLADMSEQRMMKIRAKICGLQSWMTKALNDDDTCADNPAENAMEGVKFKSPARERVLKVAQVTSNALTLVDALVSNTQSAAAAAASSLTATSASAAAVSAAAAVALLAYI